MAFYREEKLVTRSFRMIIVVVDFVERKRKTFTAGLISGLSYGIYLVLPRFNGTDIESNRSNNFRGILFFSGLFTYLE